MSATPFDSGAARILAIEAMNVPAAGHTADRAALITTILDACAEVERLRAAIAPTRGDLLVALASAGAARVDAAERLAHLPAHHINVEPARLALVAAVEAEATARAALDAFERAHGLDLTHPSTDAAAEPCPGSRGW